MGSSQSPDKFYLISTDFDVHFAGGYLFDYISNGKEERVSGTSI